MVNLKMVYAIYLLLNLCGCSGPLMSFGAHSKIIHLNAVNQYDDPHTSLNLDLQILPIGQTFNYNPMPPKQGWYTIPHVILFDRAYEPSYAFTNFYDNQPLTVINFHYNIMETWPAVENYFHAMKESRRSYQRLFLHCTPAEALAKKSSNPIPNWINKIRYEVMYTALMAKFAPGTKLGTMLQKTEKRVLVEKTCNRKNKEAHWGADDGYGENYLGRMLMVVRQSIKDRYVYPFNPSATLDYTSLQSYNFDPEKALKGYKHQRQWGFYPKLSRSLKHYFQMLWPWQQQQFGCQLNVWH